MNKMSWIKKLNEIFNKKQKLAFLGLFVIEFIGSLLELLGVSMLIPFMELVMEPTRLTNKPGVGQIMNVLGISDSRELIMWVVAAMILIYAIKNLYLVFMTYMQQQVINRNRLEMELQMMSYYVRQPYMFHVQHNSSEMQRTILSDVGNVFEVLSNVFLLLSEVLTSTMLIIMLIRTDVTITVVTILLLGIFMLVYFKVFKRRLYEYGRISQYYGAEGIKYINQMFHGVKEIKVYRSENYFINAFASGRRRQISMMKRGAFFQTTPKYFMEMITTCGVLGILFIKLATGASITDLVVQLTVFAMAAYRVLPSANHITSELAFIFNTRASVDLVYDAIHNDHITFEKQLLELKPENQKINQTDELGDVEMNHLSFRYPEGKYYILKDASLMIKGGTSVALKGPSGAGKTTTADLILGILEPLEGGITYNGADIRELGKEWYNHVGYIPQSIYLSDDSIRTNVAFGIEQPDDARVWKALEEAQLKEYVESLPDGLDSMIGENGVRISGGQRQRIGIARALYRNPEILILDEATSALDNETEKAVMESIDYLKGKKTLVIIAHRLSTLQNCDEVYEVKEGKITRTD
jgi:ABC-type multidrug transport system fused ATPase/permease subunit